MREKRNFGERTRLLTTSEPIKKYFLLYEGTDTEHIYFEALNRKRKEIKINPMIELVPLYRDYSEDGWSNPQKLLLRVMKNLYENNSGNISYETLLNRIISFLNKEISLNKNSRLSKRIWNHLEEICDEDLNVSLDDEIGDLEMACSIIIKRLEEKENVLNIVIEAKDILKETEIEYEEGFDKICLIVDRDRESFICNDKKDQYNFVLDQCKKSGFGFYVTNPCFEFWLLLHYDEVLSMNQQDLIENVKVSRKKRYTEKKLSELCPGYKKSHYKAEKFIEKIDTALANEKEFCEDIKLLEKNLGSNLGLLIREIRTVDISL